MAVSESQPSGQLVKKKANRWRWMISSVTTFLRFYKTSSCYTSCSLRFAPVISSLDPRWLLGKILDWWLVLSAIRFLSVSAVDVASVYQFLHSHSRCQSVLLLCLTTCSSSVAGIVGSILWRLSPPFGSSWGFSGVSRFLRRGEESLLGFGHSWCLRLLWVFPILLRYR